MERADQDPALRRGIERWVRAMRPVLTDRRHARHLVSLADEWRDIGLHGEALAVLDEAVPLARRADSLVLARALSDQAYCRWAVGDHEGAAAAGEEAVRLLTPLAVKEPGRFGRRLFRAQWALAVGLHNVRRWPEALPALVRYIRMAHVAPTEERSWLAEAERALRNVLSHLDDTVDGYAEAVALLRDAPRPRGS